MRLRAFLIATFTRQASIVGLALVLMVRRTHLAIVVIDQGRGLVCSAVSAEHAVMQDEGPHLARRLAMMRHLAPHLLAGLENVIRYHGIVLSLRAHLENQWAQ